jgi:Uma2 family endonuclease
MATRHRATIDDLARVPDNRKAELINGELVLMSPTGGLPGLAGGAIWSSLRAFQRQHHLPGWAYPENVGFLVNLPHRESFSPDAAFYVGEPPTMKFVQGAPVFAAEVRSEGDYGRKAEEAMTAKRADYFAAGTLVVWDVDLLGDDVVRVYRHTDPTRPTIYRRGEMAEAEPAVPGWQMPVDDLFV